MEQQNAIYDARQLGLPRMMILGVQHLFAMFGATVLVPLLTGLDVSVTLMFAGIGTLMFHFISKWNVPAFLGSSFAFLGGYASVKEMGVAQGLSETLALDYACLGVACAGLMYFVMAALIKSFGVKKILQFFPPVVRHRHRVVHLGQGYHQDYPCAVGRHRILRHCRLYGRGGFCTAGRG